MDARPSRSVPMLLSGLACAVLAAAYALQLPWAVQAWPWPDSRLGHLFVGSIFAAAAAALGWLGYSGQRAGAVAGYLNAAVMTGGIAVVLMPYAMSEGATPLLRTQATAAAMLSIGCLFGVARSLREPVRDARPVPSSLKAWFVLYMAVLLPSCGLLLADVPVIMPWPVRAPISTVYGCIFLAALCLFIVPLWRPRIEHARVGLVSFLAYDLVLIPPFVRHLDTVRPELRTTLWLYLAVLVLSAAVSAAYLFVNRATRISAAAAPTRSARMV